MEKSKKSQNFSLEEYSDLIKTVAKIEYSRLSQSAHLLEFSELINIGATTVYVVLSSQPKNHHNNSYISTAIKWAIRNELRRRYKWYSLKHSSKKDEGSDLLETSPENMREAVYETILSIEEMQQAENPMQIEDSSLNPEQSLELIELKDQIIESLDYLSEKERTILEAKFFKNRKTKDIAEELKVSSSRVSKIIQSALDKIRARLIKNGVI